MIVRHFEANLAGRDFVIGDLHGCHSALVSAMAEVNFDPKIDRLFAVGDLIDRGPDSLACLKLIQEPWFFSCRGNHEDMMLAKFAPMSAVRPNTGDVWELNGGDWAACEWPTPADIPRDLIDAAACLPFVMAVKLKQGGRVNIVHAELPHECSNALIDAEKLELSPLIWGRSRWMQPDLDYDHFDRNLSPTIVGHTRVPQIRKIGCHLYIDTGACFPGGKLSGVLL